MGSGHHVFNRIIPYLKKKYYLCKWNTDVNGLSKI